LVDGDRLRERLRRLEQLIEELERTRAKGEAAYLTDEQLRLATERRLQLAQQICIDVGAQLVSELSARPPTDYAGVFRALADAGVLPAELATRLADAARQRNLLVHAYLEIDDRQVFAALGHLDDLRAFAARAMELSEGA
jgi:uncharacterized protein YutE (UPF0331/DUF86 family)